MREWYTDAALVTYPDEVTAVFGANPVRVEKFAGTAIGLTVKHKVSGETRSEKREPFGKECFFDLSYYLQSLFDQSVLGKVDYKSNVSDNGLAAWFTVTMVLYNGDASLGELSFDVLGLWAAKLPEAEQSLVRWVGLPFTVSLFTPSKSKVTDDPNSFVVTGESVSYPVYEHYPNDVTVSTAEQTATVKAEQCSDGGVYLRWIDVWGRYRYWLFKAGDVETDVDDSGEVMRFVMGEVRQMRRQWKSATRSVEVCAPLVDRDTFDMLTGVCYSPVVDMYYDGEWLTVDIEAGSVTRTRDSLQDFIARVLFTELEVQRL